MPSAKPEPKVKKATSGRLAQYTDLTSMQVEFKDPNTGTLLGILLGSEKDFATGSVGFNANGRIVDRSGTAYQVSCNVVVTNSKPKAG